MTNVPSFNIKSKPQMTERQLDASKSDGSKFLSEPGTFDAVIKTVKFGKVSEKDNAWMTVELGLEIDKKSIRLYQMIPTECRNSYLFGANKQTFAIDKLRSFFRGLGLVFDFDNGMEQVAAVFGQPDKLVGKSLKIRLGYEGVHAKYVAKDQYQLVDRDHTTLKLDATFPNKAALAAAAREAGIKGYTLNAKGSSDNDFIKVVEIFAAGEAQLDLGATEDATTDDLPF